MVRGACASPQSPPQPTPPQVAQRTSQSGACFPRSRANRQIIHVAGILNGLGGEWGENAGGTAEPRLTFGQTKLLNRMMLSVTMRKMPYSRL